MTRPSRSWVRKTYTVSEVVAKTIAVQAAEQGIDPGTVVDILVWNAFLKPDESRLKQGGFTPEEQNRIMTEEVLPLLEGEEAIKHLANHLPPSSDGGDLMSPDSRLRQTRRLVRRWRRTRVIESEYQDAILSFLSGRKSLRGILSEEPPQGKDNPAEASSEDIPPYSERELESMFADEVLGYLKEDSAIEALAMDHLTVVDDDNDANLLAVVKLVKRWRQIHLIDKEYQTRLLTAFGDGDWVPRILEDGLVNESWFESM